MDYISPFERKTLDVSNVQRKKSLTVPGQTLSISEIVRRFESGNILGISTTPSEFDSDDPYFEEHNQFLPDPSDPLLSAFEAKQALNDFTRDFAEHRKKKQDEKKNVETVS